VKFYDLNHKFLCESSDIPNNFTGILKFFYGERVWYLNGKQHRLDGPAIDYGNELKEWWVNGKFVTELEHKLLCDIMRLKGLL